MSDGSRVRSARDRSDRSHNPFMPPTEEGADGAPLQPPPQFVPNGEQGGPSRPVLSFREVEMIVESASVDLVLPDAQVAIGPYAHLNEWDMNAVGQNLWMWVDGGVPGPVSESVEAGGAQVTMTAYYRTTRFDMGDGNAVWCVGGTKWVKGALPPGSPSPTCGYRYVEPGHYSVTATHFWDLEWEGLGQSGSFELSNTATHDLEVGELVSLIVDRDY